MKAKVYLTDKANGKFLDYIETIDLNDYDFTMNPDIWNYRKIPELQSGFSESDLELINSVEAQLKGID